MKNTEHPTHKAQKVNESSKRSFVQDGAASKDADFAKLCSQVMILVVTILFTPFVERRRYKYTGPNRVKT